VCGRVDAVGAGAALEHSFHWGYFFAGWALERLGRGSEAIDALTNAVGSSWISPSKSAPDGLR